MAGVFLLSGAAMALVDLAILLGLDRWRPSPRSSPDIASIIHRDPEIFSGQAVFVGTRVPFQTMLDYLESGSSLDEFLDHFPTVAREQAVAALRFPEQMLSDNASSAR